MWQALQAVVRDSWQELARQFAGVLPNLLAGLLIFALGLVAGFLVGAVARWVLVALKTDRGAERLGISEPLAQVGITSVSRFVGWALKWVTIAIAFIPALYTLDPRLASELASRALLYVPRLFVAAALLWIGTMLSRFLARAVLIGAVNNEMSSPRLLAAATRIAVLLVTVAIVLEHLGIGRATVITAFGVLFGGLTLAAALALGLGAQDLVRRWLSTRFQAGPPASDKEPFRHW